MDLISKYNVPAPRYTSYPTVPLWDFENFSVKKWKQTVVGSVSPSGISLYIHLPFCESLCTFCGCSKRITKNHGNEAPYIAALLREWRMYCQILGEKPVIRELHLGGGTPTFFNVRNLEDLINGIFSIAVKAPDCQMGFEGHPNNTTRAHLQKLHDLGFRRVSFGVQDYSETVQKAINRIQPFVNVLNVTLWAREIGYDSVSHDLVYGLPFQTPESIADTVEKTLALRPDRIAFYAYAHTPWIKGSGQRGFKDEDIPQGDEKRLLYEIGRELLLEEDFREIGMDHFALESDELHLALKKGRLHRNFMGYTESESRLLIGLGVSAISDSWFGFSQNTKSLDDYYQMIEWGELPCVKGHILTSEDLIARTHIRNLMCRFRTSWDLPELQLPGIPQLLERLKPMADDKLIEIQKSGIKVTEEGRMFVRNICMAFDLRMQNKQPETSVFSLSV